MAAENETLNDRQESSTADEQEQQTEEPKERHVPYDRFSEVVHEKNSLKEELAELKGKVDILSRMNAPEGKAEKKPYVDITTLSDDQVREWRDDDPIGWEKNKAKQVYFEVTQKLEEKLKSFEEQLASKQTAAKKEEHLAKWVKDNPDFEKQYKAGEIQDFMKDNPMYDGNYMAAYYEMKARKQTQAKVDRDNKLAGAKSNLRPLGGSGGGYAANKEDDRLKNPNKYGGMAAVLLARAKDRAAARE